MKLADALDALAEDYGIEAEFTDARGDRQRTSPQTKRALLAALGVPAGDEAAVREALAAREAVRRRPGLPPVLVGRPDALHVPVVLPAAHGDVVWRVELEGGGERHGRTPFADLDLLASWTEAGRQFEQRDLPLPPGLAHGYHRLSVAGVAPDSALIVTPGSCWLPPDLASGARLSGIAIQLYLLRSQTNWGIGDFGDLRRLAELVAARGGDAIGLNPLHAMFLDRPEHASPYSPASRLGLNALNIDIPAIPEFAASAQAQKQMAEPAFAQRLAACRAAPLVDYRGVAELKLAVLRAVFATFEAAAAPERAAAFAEFRARSTPSLERTHVFAALCEHFASRDGAALAPPDWPAEYRDAGSAAVERFAREHAGEVTFFAWLAWIADTQLGAAAQAASAMRVGLYRDLAVGADPAGAETWIDPQAVVAAARVGAPPDIFNPPGQNWDLPPFHPHVLREQGYRSFIELVRANMRHAGGLRIDHVMALQHLYWIPQGALPADGAYVRYPLEDFIGILALESHRARCLVVGEDLGTVPAGFRERMAAANILSYRVLFFERETDDAAAFIAPQSYPPVSLAVAGNHDLATLDAWWSGADIELRERLGRLPEGDVTAAREQRTRDRAALVAALERAEVLQPGRTFDPDAVFEAVHAFLLRTASALALVQLDDLLAEVDPVNVPTTSDEYPNWRRRSSRTLEELAANERFATFFATAATADRLRRRS